MQVDPIKVAIDLVLIVSIVSAARYLQQIRDILRDIRDGKKGEPKVSRGSYTK